MICSHCLKTILKRTGDAELCVECYATQVSEKEIESATIKSLKSKNEMISEMTENGVTVNISSIYNVKVIDLYDAYI